jgi:N-acetylglucosaminyldiphosphoundecaprenol N-acetyl-beta-D-mannosaminyltransferase
LRREVQFRVDGPTFIQRALRAGIERGWSHFFYGSTEDTLDRPLKVVRGTASGVNVAGSYAPPFRPPTDEDAHDAAHRIRDSAPDLV